MQKSIYIILSFVLLLISCQENKEINNIGETEYYFDEKLSSLSMDNDGFFWAGSETGDLFLFKDSYRQSFDLKEDRIYKVHKEITSTGDSIFWIGIRNSGLQLWKKGQEHFEKIKTFSIPFKEDKYSPYDFLAIQDRIYIATSQGIYYLNKKNRYEVDTLSLIYPSKAFLAQKDGTTFVVHNICSYKDSLLLASTQDGLFCYNVKNNKTSISFQHKVIEHVSIYNDTVFAVSKGHLYLSHIDGTPLADIKTGSGVKAYYQINGIHYLIGSDITYLSNDLKEFYHFPLRRSIPMGCRNFIGTDTLNNFTYLLTENAIWRVPNNIEVLEGNNPIKAASIDNNHIYYLTQQNELYVQKLNERKALWVYTFPDEEKIQWMKSIDNKLYYYNIDNELKSKDISKKWLINYTLNSSQTLLQSEAKITAINIKKQPNGKAKAYIGIQDGMITIDDHQKVDTVSELSKAYITSMFRHKDTHRLYIATLNNGVFYIGQDNSVRQVSETEDISFIKDLIASNDHSANIILLTNQKIISQNPDDAIRIKGYKELLYVNDTLFYALPEFGIHKFSLDNDTIIDRGILYKDIRFKAINTANGNSLVLVSNIGSLICPIDNEKDSIWVQFEEAVNVNKIVSIIIASMLLIAIVYCVISLTKKRNANLIQIKKRKEDLLARLDELIAYYDILDESERAKIINLKNNILAIDISSKDKKDVNARLKELSQQTADLNRRAALLFPQKLNEQIQQIEQTDSFDKVILLELSFDAQKANNLELIKNQVKNNSEWLTRRGNLINSLNESLSQYSDCAEIENVNKYLFSKLSLIKDSESHKPIDELIGEYNTLKKEIEFIHTSQASKYITEYIAELNNYLISKINFQDDHVFLHEGLEQIKRLSSYEDNLAILKKLRPLDDQIKVLKILDEIALCASKYKEIYDQIIRDNNKHISKKFDKELDSFIEDNTQNITRQINVHITSLYELLMRTDHHVVTEVLKLSNHEGQHARVLALLLCDFKIKRILIPGMLGIYGNLNPVISRLINNRIKPNENILQEHLRSSNTQSVFIHLVLRLLH